MNKINNLINSLSGFVHGIKNPYDLSSGMTFGNPDSVLSRLYDRCLSTGQRFGRFINAPEE